MKSAPSCLEAYPIKRLHIDFEIKIIQHIHSSTYYLPFLVFLICIDTFCVSSKMAMTSRAALSFRITDGWDASIQVSTFSDGATLGLKGLRINIVDKYKDTKKSQLTFLTPKFSSLCSS
mgnify:CR=1 FL=1